MVWTAVTSDMVNGAERFSLVNNSKYLNLDEQNENVVLNDDDVKTRWLYGAVVPDKGDSFTSMSYTMGTDTYFVKEMGMLDVETPDGEGNVAVNQEMSFTVTKETGEAMRLVVFQNSSAPGAVSDGNGNNSTLSGLFILTGTPSAIEGLDATPIPTAEEEEEDLPVPIYTGGNSGGSTTPTPANTNPGHEDPVNTGGNSGSDPASGTDSSGGNSGGNSGGDSGGSQNTPPPATAAPIEDASDS